MSNYRNREVREYISKLVDEGYNYTEISKIIERQLGKKISSSMVSYHYNKVRKDDNKEFREYILHLKDDKGMTFKEIAKKLERTHGRVMSKQAVWEHYHREKDTIRNKFR